MNNLGEGDEEGEEKKGDTQGEAGEEGRWWMGGAFNLNFCRGCPVPISNRYGALDDEEVFPTLGDARRGLRPRVPDTHFPAAVSDDELVGYMLNVRIKEVTEYAQEQGIQIEHAAEEMVEGIIMAKEGENLKDEYRASRQGSGRSHQRRPPCSRAPPGWVAA